MKTVDEKLKIWSSYLPYNLETAYCDRFGDILKVGVLNNIQYNESETHPLRLSIEGLYELEHEWMFKPFLWSMDMLTKEIEHNGERFIPIVKLFNVPDTIKLLAIGYEKKHYYSKFGFDAEIITYKIPSDVSSMNYYTVEKLLEWKFNVFNLSDDEYIKL